MEKYTFDMDSINIMDSADKPKDENLHLGPYEPQRTYTKEMPHKVKRKSALRFYFINILLGIIILLGIAAFCVVTMFKLGSIQYDGVVNSDEKELNAALFSREYCDNTIYAWVVNLLPLRQSVPFVKSVKVQMVNPTTLKVIVEEDELYLLTYTPAGEYIYIDSNGYVSEISNKFIENIPIVEGLTFENYEDNYYVFTENQKLDKSIDILKYAHSKNIDVQKIVVDEDQTVGFYCGEIFVDLGFSDNDREVIGRLPQILPSLEGQKGILHFEEWGASYKDIIFEKTSQ